MMSEIALISTSMILPMESVESAPRPRLPRYGGAALLTLIAAGCLTLSYVHEAWFIRILRISAGLGLPWIVARLLPSGPSRRSYWLRLAVSYLGVVLTGLLVILIWPFVSMVLIDSGLI